MRNPIDNDTIKEVPQGAILWSATPLTTPTTHHDAGDSRYKTLQMGTYGYHSFKSVKEAMVYENRFRDKQNVVAYDVLSYKQTLESGKVIYTIIGVRDWIRGLGKLGFWKLESLFHKTRNDNESIATPTHVEKKATGEWVG